MKKSLFIAGLSGLIIPSAMANQTQDSITSDFINQVPAYDLTHALQDRLTGIDFENPDVRPGTLLSMNIRGLRDLYFSNNPLIVINGIPCQNNEWLQDIDPADIASIQVLKDAATAALYGGEARHGVILINTRQEPAQLDRPHFTYEGYVAAKTASFRYPLMNGEQLKQYRTEMGMQPISSYYEETGSLDIDRQDIYETAWTNHHKLSMTAGWKSGYLRAGMGLTNDASIMPIDNFRRYTLHADLHQNIGSYIDLDFSTYYADAQTDHSFEYPEPVPAMNALAYMLIRSPFTPESEDDKSLREKYSELRTNRLYNSWSVGVVCPWIEGLSYHLEGGLNTFWGRYGYQSVSYTSTGNVYTWEKSTSNAYQMNLTHRFTYDKSWHNIHHLTLSAKFTNDNLTLKEYYNGKDENNRRIMQGYYAHYDFKKRYEVDWNTNVERYKYGFNAGSVVVPEKFDWKGSHSLHLQWNIHQEPFARDWAWLHLLSLRADRGIIHSPYNILAFQNREINLREGYPYVQVSITKPEKDYCNYRSSNLGIDFSLWQGRLSGSFDLYKQRNENIIGLSHLPSTAGVDWLLYSGVKTENKGWELSLQGTVIDHLNHWTWQVGLGLYANRNKLIHRSENSKHWSDGKPIRSVRDYVYDGIYNVGDPDCTASNIGTVRAKGYTEGCNIDDILHIYSLDADLKGYFNSHIQWKQLYLNLTGAFQVGGYTYCNYYQNFTWSQGQCNLPDLDLWTPSHTSGRFPKCYPGHFSSSLYWYDATMCRIHNITLGYTCPEQWTSRLGIERLNIWAAVNNPFIIHSDLYDELGIDPAPNAQSSPKTSNFGAYPTYTSMPYVETKCPTPRDFLIGLNITL